MSSRAGSDIARLRRLRRTAARLGLAILAAARPSSKIANGGYMVSDDDTRKVLLGDQPLPYSANLDQVEEYLDGLAGDREETG